MSMHRVTAKVYVKANHVVRYFLVIKSNAVF